MDPQLSKLLDRFKPYFEVQADGKVCCLPNGHCFPARYDVIHAFINGKRFPQLKKRYDAEQNLSQFEPYIIVSKNFPNMLYCTLTGQLLEKSMEAVKRHMAGKKYTYNKGKHSLGTMALKPEPDIDDVLGVKTRKGKGEDVGSEDGMEESSEGEGEEAEDESMDEDAEAGPSKKRMRLDQQHGDDGDGDDKHEDQDSDEEMLVPSDMEEEFEFEEAEPGSSGEGMDDEDSRQGRPASAAVAAANAALQVQAQPAETRRQGKPPLSKGKKKNLPAENGSVGGKAKEEGAGKLGKAVAAGDAAGSSGILADSGSIKGKVQNGEQRPKPKQRHGKSKA